LILIIFLSIFSRNFVLDDYSLINISIYNFHIFIQIFRIPYITTRVATMATIVETARAPANLLPPTTITELLVELLPVPPEVVPLVLVLFVELVELPELVELAEEVLLEVLLVVVFCC